jgi:hypothetical protein
MLVVLAALVAVADALGALGAACENSLYVFKGTPSARQTGPCPARTGCGDAEVTEGNRELA